VVPCGDNIHHDAERDECRAEPGRSAVSPYLEIRLPDLQRLEKKAESGNYEAESHERETCSNPSQKRSFRSKVICRTARRTVWHVLDKFIEASRVEGSTRQAVLTRCATAAI
jgi:hypothetical protein